MPSRMLHESILVSPTIASLSRDAEVLFYRLLVKCDDFGRFHGMPEIIQGQCYSLELEEVDRHVVAIWLGELQRADLIQLYVEDGRPYLRFTNWFKFQKPRLPARKEWNNIAPWMRRVIFRRDNHRCRLCGQPAPLEVDHIIPIVKGGTNEEDNLQTLCRTCNRQKGYS